jgi:hypothetical protein
MLRQLEAEEQRQGITPDAQVAELMSGLHGTDDYATNVAMTLQARIRAFTGLAST